MPNYLPGPVVVESWPDYYQVYSVLSVDQDKAGFDHAFGPDDVDFGDDAEREAYRGIEERMADLIRDALNLLYEINPADPADALKFIKSLVYPQEA